MAEKIKQIWTYIQGLLSIEGGLYVDAMCIVMILRVIGVFYGFPALTASEAGLWGATIMSFGYSNHGGPKQS